MNDSTFRALVLSRPTVGVVAQIAADRIDVTVTTLKQLLGSNFRVVINSDVAHT
jgi:hypothetical protein